MFLVQLSACFEMALSAHAGRCPLCCERKFLFANTPCYDFDCAQCQRMPLTVQLFGVAFHVQNLQAVEWWKEVS